MIAQVEPLERGCRVRLVPISHRPVTTCPFIEIPKGYLAAAGLDGLGCYVIPSEVNCVLWPSRARDDALLPKGQLPSAFLAELQRALVQQHDMKAFVEVDREKLARDIVEAYRERGR